MLLYSYTFKRVLYNIYHISSYIIVYRLYKYFPKPDSLTRQWDVYLKEGGSDYGTLNPQNLRPIFTTTQLVESLQATQLLIPTLQASIIMDSKSLHSDILSSLPTDPTAMQHLGPQAKPSPRWTQTDDGFLRLDN